MDLTKNRIPHDVKKIHMIAVCGTAMGALAGMLKDLGYGVTGSDQGVYPPMSDFLAGKGISVNGGFDPKHLAYKPDLVVVGNAVMRINPEAQALAEMGLPFCSMPQAVNHFVAGNKKVLMVTGTHGKTTTSSLLAWLLHESGLDPSFFIGGILRNFNSNYRIGKGEHIVIEGDEYDTAFFDKGPKFVHFNPHMAVMTSVEFDHADIFKNLDHVKSFFDRLLVQMKPDSTLVAFDQDDNIKDLIQNRACRVVGYSGNGHSPWGLGEIHIASPWTMFEARKNGKCFGKFRTKLVGRHNLLNALSVIAVADNLGIGVPAIGSALETFLGPRRRQEVRGVKNGITVMDDFAHHPTAVRETIKAVRPHYTAGRVIAVFEPRTNTSMRQVFQDVYPLVFDDADMVCIRKPSRLDKIPVNERFSSEKLVADLQKREKAAFHFEDTDSIIAFLADKARPGDLILIMSNGGFDNIHKRLLEVL